MLLRFTAGLCGLMVCTSVLADAQETLTRASESARTSNYQGVVIYRSGSSMESLRVIHGFEGGIERERISALNGVPREILRQNGKVTCLLPNERKLDFKRPALKGLLTQFSPEVLAQLQNWYELRELGMARIAGRACRGVALVPKDDYRYGFSIWSDSERGVPLKVAVSRQDGAVIEELMFTEIEFPASLPAQVFEPESDPSRFKALTRPEPIAADSADLSDFPMRFGELPPGFKISLHDHRSAADGSLVEHVMVSDGLSAVSVFAARDVAPGKAINGLIRMGAIHAWGRAFGRLHVTVIGETPPATVKRIGESMTLNSAADKTDKP